MERHHQANGSYRNHPVSSWNHLFAASSGMGSSRLLLEFATNHRSTRGFCDFIYGFCGLAVLNSERYSYGPCTNPTTTECHMWLCISIRCRRDDAHSLDLHATLVSSNKRRFSLPFRRKLPATCSCDGLCFNNIRRFDPESWILHSVHDPRILLYGSRYWLTNYFDPYHRGR